MMESIALTESPMVVKEVDYVIVDDADSMELDLDDYDYCDDFISSGDSPQSCDFSVGSVDIQSIEQGLGLETLNEEIKGCSASVISLDLDGDGDGDGDDDDTGEPAKGDRTDEEMRESADSADDSPAMEREDDFSKEEEAIERVMRKESSRLSNKKRRKKMKVLKKEAAAAAAADALAAMRPRTKLVVTSKTNQPKATHRSNRKSPNVAVSCVTESMQHYRETHNIKAKKPQNPVCLL